MSAVEALRVKVLPLEPGIFPTDHEAANAITAQYCDLVMRGYQDQVVAPRDYLCTGYPPPWPAPFAPPSL